MTTPPNDTAPTAKITKYTADGYQEAYKEQPRKRVRLVKTFSIDEPTSKLEKGDPGIISTGNYTTHDISLEQLKVGISGFTEQQALGLGTADNEQGKIGFKHWKGEIRRINKNFHYRKQPTFFYLDIDGIDSTPEQIINIISKIVPGFSDAGRLTIPSSSAGLYSATGEPLKDSTSVHIYFIIQDGTDAHRFMDALFDRLWLAGYGFYVLSAAPSLLKRGIIDTAVVGSERLVYEGAPLLLDGIVQKRDEPNLIPGGMVDTTLTLDLTADEKKSLETIMQTEKEKISPEMNQAVEAKADKIAATQKISKEAALRIVSNHQRGMLDDNLLLYFLDENEPVKVSAVLGNGEKYNFKNLADPLDPTYDGSSKTKAKFFWNGGDSPKINSNAHGGIIYAFAKNNGDGQAPWPEPEPLPNELLPVEPFVYDLLPDSLHAWVKDICERIQCPPDFVAVGVMVALAAVIGRKTGMGPQKYTDWIEIPNLWGLIIGRPGILKSPALEAALAPLKRLVANALNSYEEAFKEFAKESMICKLRSEEGEKKAKATLKKDSTADISKLLMMDKAEEPTLHRYMTNDSSPAALGELLRHNQNGVLVYRDELVSLIKGLDREENTEGRGFYLTGWNGNSPYTFDRIGRGMNLHIDAVCLSVLGGTQPGKIGTYIGHAVKGGESDDGLIQRFSLMVWPDNSKDWQNVDRWPDNEAKNEAFKVFDYLDKLNPLDIGAIQDTDNDGQPDGIPYLRFNNNALELFNEWRHALEIRIRDDSLPPYLESHFSKYRKLIPALSLLIHLCEGGHGAVTEGPTLKALAWGEYLESHARRIYQAGANNEVGTANAILKKIKDGSLKNGFKGWDVWRPNWSMLTDRPKVNAGLTMLVDYDYLRAKIDYETGGRNSTTYQINPGCLP